MKEHQAQRRIGVKHEEVFEAFTEAAALSRWWGPEGFSATSVEVHPSPGGSFSIVMRGPDGVDYPLRGHFAQIRRPDYLELESEALAPDGRVLLKSTASIGLKESEGATLLDLRVVAEAQVPEAQAMVEGLPAGWNQTLQRLADYLLKIQERQVVTNWYYKAPRERVFRAWTQAAEVSRWWGPAGFATTVQEMEVREGGLWRFVMHGPDKVDYPNLDRYVEVRPPELLIFDHEAPPFRMTVTFDEMMGGTVVSLRQAFPTVEARKEAVEVYHAVTGASQTLERLGAFLG